MIETSHEGISIKKTILIMVLTWILSLVSTLAIVYVWPNLFPVKTNQISDEAIITTKLANGTVTSAKILDGAIIASDLADGSVLTIKVASGAVTTTKIADNAITTGKLADSSVASSKIVDGAIVTVKMADNSVSSAKIIDGTITAVDLASGSIITAKIADGAVTNLKLAPSAIPFASTYSTTEISTTARNWADMADMAVTLTLDRTSHILIMFSTVARNDDPSFGYRKHARALVGVDVAFPEWVYLTPFLYPSDTHTHALFYSAYSYNFYLPSVSTGTYTIKIQWWATGGTAFATSRSLTVIALPA